jgi:choline dehydrogenase-like flavoprotein
MQTYAAVGAAPTKARETFRHRVAIIGGGMVGITVAAQLARQGIHDVALIEPSPKHYYQPLWTLVGAGRQAFRARVGFTVRGRADGVGHAVGGRGCGDGLADGQGV